MHFQGVGTESGLSFTIWNILYKTELTRNYEVGWMIMIEIIFFIFDKMWVKSGKEPAVVALSSKVT